MDQSNDMIIAAGDKYEHGGHQKMVMLIGMYFPDLKTELDELIKCRDLFNKADKALSAEYSTFISPETAWAIETMGLAVEQVSNKLLVSIISVGSEKRYIQAHSKSWHNGNIFNRAMKRMSTIIANARSVLRAYKLKRRSKGEPNDSQSSKG